MIISYACGCGDTLEENDSHYRKRKYINGHNGRKYADPTQYKREWNHRNRESRYMLKQKTYHKRKVLLINLKGANCTDCGIHYDGKNASIFQFHHLDPRVKDFAVSNQVMNKSWQNLLNEVEKCVLLCANCHFMRHAKEF